MGGQADSRRSRVMAVIIAVMAFGLVVLAIVTLVFGVIAVVGPKGLDRGRFAMLTLMLLGFEALVLVQLRGYRRWMHDRIDNAPPIHGRDGGEPE